MVVSIPTMLPEDIMDVDTEEPCSPGGPSLEQYDRILLEDPLANCQMSQYRKSSLTNISQSWHTWQRHCKWYGAAKRIEIEPLEHLRQINYDRLRIFIMWYLDTHSKCRQYDSIRGRIKVFFMMYRQKTHQIVDKVFSNWAITFLQNYCIQKYGLKQDKKEKKSISVEDALLLMKTHWELMDDNFRTERERVQLPLVWLLLAYTAARPATLLSTQVYNQSDDSILYSDIELLAVRDGDRKDQAMLIMKLTTRLYKGRRNQGTAPVFVFHERDDNLAFCVILHVLALALADGAFLDDCIRSPEDVKRTQIPEFLESIPIRWKPEWRDRPLFRKAERVQHGWRTSLTKPWTDVEARNQTDRVVAKAGFKSKITLYSFRRGAGRAIDENTTSAIRNQVMGHRRSAIYHKYYTTTVVGVDTMSAFLGTPAKAKLVRLAGMASIDRDPRFHEHVKEQRQKTYETSSEVTQLQIQVQELRDHLRFTFGQICRAKGKPIYRDYTNLKSRLHNAKTRVDRKTYEEKKRKYFDEVGTNELKKQQYGEVSQWQPKLPVFRLRERQTLAELLCRNDDVTKTEEETVAANRRDALEALVSLASKAIPQQKTSTQESEEPQIADVVEASKDPGGRPELVSSHSNGQCPWCTATFKSARNLRRHMTNIHIPHKDFETDPGCPFGDCMASLENAMHLMNHFECQHGITFGRQLPMLELPTDIFARDHQSQIIL